MRKKGTEKERKRMQEEGRKSGKEEREGRIGMREERWKGDYYHINQHNKRHIRFKKGGLATDL